MPVNPAPTIATSTRKPSVRGCDVTGMGKDQRGSPQGWARFCKRSLLTKDGSYVRQIPREQEIVNTFLAWGQQEPKMVADAPMSTTKMCYSRHLWNTAAQQRIDMRQQRNRYDL